MSKLVRYVLARSIPVPESGCWIWLNGLCKNGYGLSCKYSVGTSRAHRASYMALVGQIPEGLFVCHTCDVRDCVNPDHLYLGTAADNMADVMNRKRHPLRNATHCQRGHEFTEANTYWDPRGHRNCRVCKMESLRKSKERARMLVAKLPETERVAA